jgi:hypothetical protein
MTTYIARRVRLAAGAIAATLFLVPQGARADAVHDWNAIMQSTVGAQAPFLQARFAAIMQLAVFEAVNGITKTYKPYLNTTTGQAGASAEAAAVAAAHTVLKAYFPGSATSLGPPGRARWRQ